MLTRTLGSTGISVSSIGFGMAAVGRPGYITLGHEEDLSGQTSPSALEQHAHRMLDTAQSAGITYIDAARSYGKAEAFLGSWLKSRQPSPTEMVVGSKWGYIYTADWRTDAEIHETKVHTRENLDRQFVESSRLIGSHLSLYQIHSATRQSGVLASAEVLGRLAELRANGLVIGLSTSGPNQSDTIRQALEIEIDGRLLFGSVQATWNLLEPSAGAALAEASDAGLGVIVKEAAANGRLTSRNRDIADWLGEAGPQQSPDALAIAACLQQPWATVVLSGAATIDQLLSNLKALDVPQATIQQLPDLAEPAHEYWTTRGSLPWQ